MTGYCIKCRAHREILNPVILVNEKGGRYADGKCPVCGIRLVRFLKKEVSNG